MNDIPGVLRRVSEDLTELKYGFALVGGLAVSARVEPRFTRDIDLVVAVENDSRAEALVYALQQRGYSVLASVEQEKTKRLATIRLAAPGDGSTVVDLLFASSGIESEVVAAAEAIEIFADLHLSVARTGHLIALKVLARDDRRRPRDIADLRALIPETDAAERQLARSALELIAQRGFARDKDLIREWALLLSEAP